MSNNILVTLDKDIVVTSKGATVGDAVNDAFTRLRKLVYGQVPGPIVHMEPTSFSVERCKTQKRTERFLWLLWPRQKQEVELIVNIKVSIRYIRIDGLEKREG